MHLDYLTNDRNPALFASKVERKKSYIYVFLTSSEVVTVSVVSNTHNRVTKIRPITPIID